MKSNTSTAQRTVAAESKKRGGRNIAASQNHHRTQNPWNKIATTLETSFGNSIYVETMEFALEHLHEEGVETASLFNAKTGEVTEKGREAITAAIDEGWQKTVDLAACDNYDTKPELTSLLSHRAVFDHITADLVKRGYLQKPQATLQVTAPKTN